jgi:hypothetical protein
MAYRFEPVSTEGEILETAEQRWQTGDTVVAHGNRRYRVVSVIPVEQISEFVDERAYRRRARGRAALGAGPDRLRAFVIERCDRGVLPRMVVFDFRLDAEDVGHSE